MMYKAMLLWIYRYDESCETDASYQATQTMTLPGTKVMKLMMECLISVQQIGENTGDTPVIWFW